VSRAGCSWVAVLAAICQILQRRGLEISNTSSSGGLFVISSSWVQVPPPAPVFIATCLPLHLPRLLVGCVVGCSWLQPLVTCSSDDRADPSRRRATRRAR